MGLGIVNRDKYIEIRMPLHDNINFTIRHLRLLANELEAIKNQKILKGYNDTLTQTDSIEEIGVSKYFDLFSLNVLIRKNGDFTLFELDKALDPINKNLLGMKPSNNSQEEAEKLLIELSE